MPSSCPRSTSAAVRARLAQRHRRRQRHLDREMRAAIDGGVDLDLVVEHARNPLHDRQPEPEPARHLGALIEPVKFLEDRLPLGDGNAEPGVVDVDAQMAVVPAAADQHAALRRVLDRVRHQVLQEPAQQPAVRLHRQRAVHEIEPQALAVRQRRELDLELPQDLVDPQADEFRLHGAGVEPRDVEQRADDLLDRVERGIDIADELRRLAAALALDQAGDVEARGIERLQDVVAGRRQEAGLRDVGLLGAGLGARELGVEAGELLGALAHAPLQRLVGALELVGRLHARGDVGEGRDDAAVRHRVGAHLHHQVALGNAFQERHARGDVLLHVVLHQRLDRVGVGIGARGVEAQDFVERRCRPA